MGDMATFIMHVDEDGSLANSTNFHNLLLNLNCLLKRAGSDNGTNNGMVKVGNWSRANMVQSLLSTMNFPFGHTLSPSIHRVSQAAH